MFCFPEAGGGGVGGGSLRCGHSQERLGRDWSDLAGVGVAGEGEESGEIAWPGWWRHLQGTRQAVVSGERSGLLGLVTCGITEAVGVAEAQHRWSLGPGVQGQFCFVSPLGQFPHFPFALSSHLSLAPSPWCILLLCLLPKAPGPLVDLAAVSRLRRLLGRPLSPERHWAAKGGQSLR